MVAVVRVTNLQILGGTTLLVEFEAQGSWGNSLTDSAQGDLGSSLGQLASAVKAKVIAWAATPGGGDVALTPANILVLGLGDDQISGVRKITDDATSSLAFTNVPGLSFELAPLSHYKFKFKGGYTAAAATTGLQLSVDGPASPNFMRAVGWIYTSSAGASTPGAIGAYDAAIAASGSAGAAALPFEIEGTISTGAAGGTFALRYRSEVNGSAVTILRGSFGELTAV